MKEHPYLKNKQKSNDRVDESYDTYLSNYVAMKNAGGGSNEICVYDPVTVDATLGKHTNYKVKVSMRGGRTLSGQRCKRALRNPAALQPLQLASQRVMLEVARLSYSRLPREKVPRQ